MFEKLRSALSALTSIASQRVLSEKEVDRVIWDFEISLLESDVAQEVVNDISSKMKEELTGLKIERATNTEVYLKSKLADLIDSIFIKASQIDVLQIAKEKKTKGEPLVIVFLGINGTGKTTTIAKFANLMKKAGFTTVLSCSDTHRAGAIEQLTEHANRLSIKTVSQSYGADPAAVARDAVLHAKAHHIDTVLIDTAGRMQTSRNLMEEMAKIIRVVKPDLKIFVGDALAGNDVISQAKEFLSFTDFDAAILTKVDADVKGGSALSISYVTGKPIIYLGIGQTYDDFVAFDTKSFTSTLLGGGPRINQPL
jgi:fused signal recognition particle receptor